MHFSLYPIKLKTATSQSKIQDSKENSQFLSTFGYQLTQKIKPTINPHFHSLYLSKIKKLKKNHNFYSLFDAHSPPYPTHNKNPQNLHIPISLSFSTKNSGFSINTTNFIHFLRNLLIYITNYTMQEKKI